MIKFSSKANNVSLPEKASKTVNKKEKPNKPEEAMQNYGKKKQDKKKVIGAFLASIGIGLSIQAGMKTNIPENVKNGFIENSVTSTVNQKEKAQNISTEDIADLIHNDFQANKDLITDENIISLSKDYENKYKKPIESLIYENEDLTIEEKDLQIKSLEEIYKKAYNISGLKTKKIEVGGKQEYFELKDNILRTYDVLGNLLSEFDYIKKETVSNEISPEEFVLKLEDNYLTIYDKDNNEINSKNLDIFINVSSLNNKYDIIGNIYNSDGNYIYRIVNSDKTCIMQHSLLPRYIGRELIADINKNFKYINPNNICGLNEYFEEEYNKPIETVISENKNLSKKEKENYISELKKIYMEIYNIEEGKSITSKIKNDYYEGKEYTLKYENNQLFVYDSEGNELKSQNVNELITGFSLNDKIKILNVIYNLPAEITLDMLNETNIKPSKLGDKHRSYYIDVIDSVYLAKDTDLNGDVITHENGHAMDFSSGIPVSFLNSKIYQTYKEELKNFINDGNIRYKEHDSFNSKKFGYEGNIKDYATENNLEMFAECYALLMTGDCTSKDCILKYFPKTLEQVKSDLPELRESRETKYFVKKYMEKALTDLSEQISDKNSPLYNAYKKEDFTRKNIGLPYEITG